MKTPHIHADVIKAWADGAEIEVIHNTISDGWLPTNAPDWSLSCSYRVKPERKLDNQRYVFATFGRDLCAVFGVTTVREKVSDNLRLTFDGETNNLIKAEVLK
jgi:hypothetical protein